MGIITDRAMQLSPTAVDLWLVDGAPRGEGRFMGRITAAGERTFYYRYTREDSTRDTLRIGPYDPRGVKGMKLTVARAKAAECSALYRSGIRDLRQHFRTLKLEEEIAADRARRQEEDATAEVERVARRRAPSANCSTAGTD